MHWALSTLGVGPDADERAIKRAYAAKLKTTRPEEDPQGFQALNEAYRTALAQCTLRAANSAAAEMATALAASERDPHAVEAPAVEASQEATPPADAGRTLPAIRMMLPTPPLQPLASMSQASAQPPRFDEQAFFGELLARGRNESPDGLRRWLENHEALYSIRLKASLVVPLAQFLDRSPPMTREHLDATLAFFGLDTVNGQTMRLQDVLHRLRRNARRAETDWNDIMSNPDRNDRLSGVVPKHKPTSVALVLSIIFMLSMLARCAGSYSHIIDAQQGLHDTRTSIPAERRPG